MQSDLVTQYSGMVPLALQNADPNSWDWKMDSTPWKLAEGMWQRFSSQWYGRDEISLVSGSSLSLQPLDAPSKRQSLLVRESYVDIFDRIWAKAFQSKGLTGTIITGQPGTGKSLFNRFFLVRLLQRKQTVLFSTDGKWVFLFHLGQVYHSSTSALLASGDPELPEPKSPDVFIWSIFDIEETEHPARFFFASPCLPVQTASPDPRRYKIWDKEYRPMRVGMPLWTRPELVLGLKHQIKYDSLLDALRKYPDQRALASFDGTHILLQERSKDEDDAGAFSPADALDYLLDESIVRFGYSARDVYDGVFDYEGTTREHEEAFGITYDELIKAVRASADASHLPPHALSHKILASSPMHSDAFSRVCWQLNFKSNWVARAVIRSLDDAENTQIGRCISYFNRIPQASQLAERFLEPFAHRAILDDTKGDSWPLTKMTQINANANSPSFTMSSPDPDSLTFPKVEREAIKFFSLDSVVLSNNRYYIPMDLDFPLFDAFTVELDPPSKSAYLWVLQTQLHRGSARSYQTIRNIIAKLKAMLKQEAPKQKSRKETPGQSVSEVVVHVHYLLVVPKGDRNVDVLTPTVWQWAFPHGWHENCKRNDHRGSVHCLQVDVSVDDIAAQFEPQLVANWIAR